MSDQLLNNLAKKYPYSYQEVKWIAKSVGLKNVEKALKIMRVLNIGYYELIELLLEEKSNSLGSD